MRHNGFAARLAGAASAIAAVAAILGGATGAAAQERPADLTELPPVPTDYDPGKTAWGDPNLSHSFQYEYLNNMRILVQRPKVFGNRVWLTDEEFARRLAAAERSDSSFAAASENGVGTPGTEGLADFIKNSSLGHRTSLIVSPADGQLPPLTPQAEALYKQGRGLRRQRRKLAVRRARTMTGSTISTPGTAASAAASRRRCFRSATTTACGSSSRRG